MRFTSLFPIACLLLLAVLSTAWQLDGLMAHGQLMPRQDDSNSDSDSETTTTADDATTGASPTADETATETTTETASSTSSSDDDSEETNTASITSTSSGSTSTSTRTSSSNGTTSVDARLPPGGISMITPGPYATTYYMIGETLTFVWNYTSLSITPSAVNVIASCSLNSATYTISSNMTISPTQTVIWDTKKYQANATVPLLTATYTLIVYDEDKGIDDVAGAGELSSQVRNYFGMYISQSYEDLGNFVCATCSGAVSSTEAQGLKLAVGMAVVSIISFTWFASSFGVFST
ncbi:hypothetical protein BDW59DRAFT_105437 [Aspergillus cavernicola]|uniref:DUF7137 domain-containing protein n=1 Tax=Aspergillus cavernicola TaxID=176166 RepID=A0ABR4IY21_9EURO